jgi:glycosyltransferase involved in cell wall biosynthesis
VRVHTFHGHVLGGYYFSPSVTRFYLELERLLARISHRLVVLTPGQRHEMAEHLRVAPAERFSVIPLGLELETFRTVDRVQARKVTRRDLGLAADDLVVGIVGRLVPVKNHELLFRAHSILEEVLGRPVQVIVVGSGLREKELREFVSREGVPERVHWLGWREGLEALYPALDVLALTSLDEGTPVAVLEALASGTPVVARAVGGVPEILERVAMAELVGDPQPEAMARALARTLERVLGGGFPPETVARIRRETADRFSVERLARDMEALYTEELAQAGLIKNR